LHRPFILIYFLSSSAYLTSPRIAIIELIDTGIGIPEDEQKLIFDRFYRVNKARSRDRGGSGLGLAIASAIALAHQGNIKVKSQLEQGSIFTVYLPILNSKE